MKSLYSVQPHPPGPREPALLPCPFCGSAALIRSDGSACKVGCFNPQCGIRPKASSTCEDTCFRHWNARTDPQIPQTPADSVTSEKSVEDV